MHQFLRGFASSWHDIESFWPRNLLYGHKSKSISILTISTRMWLLVGVDAVWQRAHIPTAVRFFLWVTIYKGEHCAEFGSLLFTVDVSFEDTTIDGFVGLLMYWALTRGGMNAFGNHTKYCQSSADFGDYYEADNYVAWSPKALLHVMFLGVASLKWIFYHPFLRFCVTGMLLSIALRTFSVNQSAPHVYTCM